MTKRFADRLRKAELRLGLDEASREATSNAKALLLVRLAEIRARMEASREACPGLWAQGADATEVQSDADEVLRRIGGLLAEWAEDAQQRRMSRT
jgi:hypothetical protein